MANFIQASISLPELYDSYYYTEQNRTEWNAWFCEIPILRNALKQAKTALYLRYDVLVLARDGFQTIPCH